jgi:hypothetical protein
MRVVDEVIFEAGRQNDLVRSWLDFAGEFFQTFLSTKITLVAKAFDRKLIVAP